MAHISYGSSDAETLLAEGRKGVPKMVLVLTDGLPSSTDKANSEAAFLKIKKAGLQVMMVLIGGAIRSKDVASWVTTPERAYFFIYYDYIYIFYLLRLYIYIHYSY